MDGVISTMTYHELQTTTTEEISRVLRPGGSLVIADWSNEGEGVRGPPLSERTSASQAVSNLESAGFDVLRAQERPETFFIEAVE